MLYYLNPERRGDWRYACRLEIRVWYLHQLSGTESAQRDWETVSVQNNCGICYEKYHLSVYIVLRNGDQPVIICINPEDSCCCYTWRCNGRLRRASYSDWKCIALRRDASCHTGRKGDIDPHSLAQITETYRQSEGIQDNGIVIYVKLQLVCRGNSALPWDGIGDKDISGVVIWEKTSSITALSIRRTLPRDTMEPKLSVAISNLLRDKIVFFIIIWLKNREVLPCGSISGGAAKLFFIKILLVFILF